MSSGSESAETVLVVDDEDSVRKTFREWLEGARLGESGLYVTFSERCLTARTWVARS